MAFHEIERGVFGASRPALSNAVKVHSSNRGQIFTFSIARDIYRKLGAPMFLNVLIGSGEHSGFIAMIPRNTRGSASYKMTTGKGCVTPRFSIHPKKIGVVPRMVEATKIPFEITEDGLIVDIRVLRQPSLAVAVG